MLYVAVPLAEEGWDEQTQEFIPPPVKVLQLEHSLVSLSKWESKYCKPFLSTDKTDEETLDYIKMMTITQNVDPKVYNHLTQNNIEEIRKYIHAPMTATTFPKERRSRRNNEVITNEVIYHWMVALNIPFECQKWHINRLLTLIRVCEIKSQPPKKMSKRETMSNYRALNEARKKQLNTKG